MKQIAIVIAVLVIFHVMGLMTFNICFNGISFVGTCEHLKGIEE